MIGEEQQFDTTQPSDAVGGPSGTDTTPNEGSSTSGLADDLLAMADAVTPSASSGGTDASGGASVADGVDYQALLAAKDTEIQALKSQVEERTGQCVRLAADFDNYRKRAQRDRDELELQIKCNTINELLPVVDNFERARSQIKPQTDQETNIHKSYQSVYKLLVDCLKRIGVAPMRAEGKEFDPNLHEAVMRQASEEYPEGTVIEEMQRGYMLGERVLRHALVKVAAAPDPVIPSEEAAQGSTES